METSLKIRSITLISYIKLPESHSSYVKFSVLVEGKTRFIHSLSLIPDEYPKYKFSTRYSELHSVHHELKELFPSLELPTFPKKKWLGGHSESFILKRIRQLNDYFSQLLLIHEVNSSEPLMSLISPKHSIKVAIIGGRKEGKKHLINLFTRQESCHPLYGRSKSQLPYKTENFKFQPTDLVVDEKLFRISQIRIENFNGPEGQEKIFLSEIVAQHDAAVFIYKERGTAGHAFANRMFDFSKSYIPSILVNWDSSNYINEFSVRNEQDAYDAFVGLVKEYRSIKLHKSNKAIKKL